MTAATETRPTQSVEAPKRESLRILALFAGIGGIETGLQAYGHEAAESYEVDPAARAVLRAKFPAMKLHGDIRELESVDPAIDIITAGFPCVDLSQAGGTRGLAGPSSGLVRHVLDIVARNKVRHLCLENVPFMLRLGRGQAMAEIVASLERAAFAWAYRVVDARSFGVPQRRPRVLLFASREWDPRHVLLENWSLGGVPEIAPIVDQHAIGFYSTEGNTGAGLVAEATPPLKPGSQLGIKSFPAVLLTSGLVGTPSIEDGERLQGFDPGWTAPAEGLARNVRWRLVGNAVNVNVSTWLGKRLAWPRLTSPLPAGAPLLDGEWPSCAWNVGLGRFGLPLPAHFKGSLEMRPLSSFLSTPLEPLSKRACDGFVYRAEASSLRFPQGFIEALKQHSRRKH